MMERIAEKILSQLLADEKELPVRAAPKPEQRDAADHWTRPILLERAAYLSKLAKYGDGSASETIKDYPQHSAMLVFRSRDGDPEVHEDFAQIFYVLQGSARLMTGSAEVGEGSLRGALGINGFPHLLRAGDVAHIPAGQPHQWLVSSDNPVVCLVLRVRENP
jgi:mannose-6-phosphate isomerase-like protein (cupin superfamily)